MMGSACQGMDSVDPSIRKVAGRLATAKPCRIDGVLMGAIKYSFFLMYRIVPEVKSVERVRVPDVANQFENVVWLVI